MNVCQDHLIAKNTVMKPRFLEKPGTFIFTMPKGAELDECLELVNALQVSTRLVAT